MTFFTKNGQKSPSQVSQIVEISNENSYFAEFFAQQALLGYGLMRKKIKSFFTYLNFLNMNTPKKIDILQQKNRKFSLIFNFFSNCVPCNNML